MTELDLSKQNDDTCVTNLCMLDIKANLIVSCESAQWTNVPQSTEMRPSKILKRII